MYLAGTVVERSARGIIVSREEPVTQLPVKYFRHLLIFLFVTISASSFFALVRLNLLTFPFFSAGHLSSAELSS